MPRGRAIFRYKHMNTRHHSASPKRSETLFPGSVTPGTGTAGCTFSPRVTVTGHQSAQRRVPNEYVYRKGRTRPHVHLPRPPRCCRCCRVGGLLRQVPDAPNPILTDQDGERGCGQVPDAPNPPRPTGVERGCLRSPLTGISSRSPPLSATFCCSSLLPPGAHTPRSPGESASPWPPTVVS